MLSACPAGGVTDGTVLEIEDFTQKLDVSFLLCLVYLPVLFFFLEFSDFLDA